MRVRISILFLVLCSCLCLAASATATVNYVNAASTSGSPDGLSWATAYTTIGRALQDATNGDQVWVQAGTYTENPTIPDGVALYGGFAGTETSLSQRNSRLNTSTINGTSSTAATVIIDYCNAPRRSMGSP